MKVGLMFPIQLYPDGVLGSVQRDDRETLLAGGVWYTAAATLEGVVYRFPAGTLSGANWLTADLITDDDEAAILVLALCEGEAEDAPTFLYQFSLLPHASARLRVPLEAVNQNRWMYPREGALLKPRVAGVRVNLARVNWMAVTVLMKADAPVRWCMTPFTASVDEPPLLDQPLLTRGSLIDELGQSATRNWRGKTQRAADVVTRLQNQLTCAPQQKWPAGFSRYGGWTGRRFDASGFFRTQWEAGRWWLIDPEGYIFWSAGQDCVRVDTDANFTHLESALTWIPEANSEFASIIQARRGEQSINYLQANFIRAFGPDQWYARWAEITLSLLRSNGFNTVANWSEWKIAQAVGFPYVRPLDARELAQRTPLIYRDFPDVFDPRFEEDAAVYAQQLEDTRDDPAFIGYFLMNEPTWGFSQETPAAGMLFNTPSCKTRDALVGFLRERYSDDAALAAAWQIETTLDAVQSGVWTTPLSQSAQADLAEFSQVMVERFFGTLSAACRKVDPNHLNLGIRYHIVPPLWAQNGMRSFDVFSINCYQERVPADDLKAIHDLLGMPTMIGEWHFGALDVGLPASGVGARVRDQAARGKAYRYYVEQAAAIPWCVGTHHFTYYDQSALGRFDGEAYNIGFYDVCNRPYTELTEAARLTHERLYPVALGEVEPFADEPEYLERFFF